MKTMIIVISRMLAVEVLTLFISIESICPKPQMMADTRRAAPPNVNNIVRLNRLIFWYRLVTMIPARVEKKVASRIGMKMSVGCAAPIWARYTNIEIGISVSPLVFSTRNMIIGFEAVSFFVFSSCNCSIAFRPSGVAALSSPNMLAAMFIKIEPVTGCPLGMSGNSFTKMGLSSFASTFTIPPFSPIFMMPSQSERTPVRPNEISNAVFDDEKVESIIAGNTSKSPRNTSFTKAITKAMMKNAIQI